MNSKINVEIRIKPSIENTIDSNSKSLTVGTKTYNFDKVHLTTSQKQLYTSSIEPLLSKFIEGYNCSVLAYGQTGSGKTYTMGISELDTSGIVPQSLEYLFKNLNEKSLTCTFIEIYNEEVIDLLSSHKVPLSLREIKGEVHVAGANEVNLNSVEEGLDVLRRGCRERTTKSTKMNSQSSRSHAIFTLFLRRESRGLFISSKFSFVDLAGSERLKRTLCIGERARESISINSGLLALGNVISALYKKAKHVPFRDSKLTRILHSCLNGHVLMIACISSSQSDMNETHNTLKYANRAASIQTATKLNVEVDNTKMAVILLKKEISKLKTENQILKSRIQTTKHANIEGLIRENRLLKSQIENIKYDTLIDEKNEDLAQEILKHPFVQNLINDNQKLTEEVERLKGEVNGIIDVNKSPPYPKVSPLSLTNRPKVISPPYQNELKNTPILSKAISPILCKEISPSCSKAISPPCSKAISPLCSPPFTKPIPKAPLIPKDPACLKTTSPVLKIPPRIKTSPSEKISWNPSKQRKVTFKLEDQHNRRTLFTPRKEKVELNTDIIRSIGGYTAQFMAIRDDHLIFSSLDNKVRIWKERIEDLFTDTGIRHLISDSNIFYTTRTILKQFDHRGLCMPVYAYKSEINCINKIQTKIYTGHEDGTLNVLDLRNMQIESIKLHTGSIFCIENINDKIFTGSRDHSVKSISHGIVTLSPPHCDSVISLLNYKGDLVSLGRDSSIRRWSNNKLIRTVNNSHSTNLKTGVPLENYFVTGDKGGLLKFWDFHKSNMFAVGQLDMNNPINCICRSGEGFYVGTSRKNISYIVGEYLI
ncbi:Kinesin-like protein KIF21B [Nosema bombycis CQ1]|uniref:Kinesin-like protein n=1 Tax=Nosema bombycis (strain CQ1 / CVCC 102059) TaxID=578461 RepID=R0MH25_NOSB1|nr:Kinesin-like protein KIF21B [Nosema bombycis CQ1]|eukprot:EOB13410.1 Kinesin-like protein KIF21B [Nosema bombycis CQ1]